MMKNEPMRGHAIDITPGLNEDEIRKSVPPTRRGHVLRRLSGTPHVEDPNDLYEVEVAGQVLRIRRRYLEDVD